MYDQKSVIKLDTTREGAEAVCAGWSATTILVLTSRFTQYFVLFFFSAASVYRGREDEAR